MSLTLRDRVLRLLAFWHNLDDVSTPAGWYPDPDASGMSRLWDGEGWTDAQVPTDDLVPSTPRSRPGGVPLNLAAIGRISLLHLLVLLILLGVCLAVLWIAGSAVLT